MKTIKQTELSELKSKAEKYDQITKSSSQKNEDEELLIIPVEQKVEKEKDEFTCEKCEAVIQEGENPCHNCGAELVWQ